MRRMIELLDGKYEVTVFGEAGSHRLQVADQAPEPASLDVTDAGDHRVCVGDETARMKLMTKGEWIFIRAFDRTLTLRIIDPVEQAEQESVGHGKRASAPMPGTVVEVRVKAGDRVAKGQALMVIESMKILTVIAAPRDGEIDEVHFTPGQTFDKNAALITLADTEEAN